MPNIKNVLIGTVFLSLAVFTFLQHGSPWMIGLLFAASMYLFVIAFTGLSSEGVADLQDAIDFVRNPREALTDRIMDTVLPDPDAEQGTERKSILADFIAEVRGDEGCGDAVRASSEKPFDPDAVIAKYLADRPQQAPAGEAAGLGAAARPTFGRKQA
jgi:hypothetical protein